MARVAHLGIALVLLEHPAVGLARGAAVAVAFHAREEHAGLRHLVLFEPGAAVRAGKQKVNLSRKAEFGEEFGQDCISLVCDATI